MLYFLVACNGEDPPAHDSGPPPPALDQIELLGERLYPEGIASAANGTLYIGSLQTGEIQTAAPSDQLAEIWLEEGQFEPLGIMGLEVEDPAGVLWFCTSEFAKESALVAYNIAAVTELHSFPFPVGGFCNDVAIGSDGSVYATDSFGGAVFRVPPDRSSLEEWGEDPSPAGEGALGLNGIVVLGNTVYAVRYDDGGLVAWAIDTDGTATPGVEINLARPLGKPDGLAVHGDRLIVVEGSRDQLGAIELDGAGGAAVTPITGQLSTATTVAVVGDDAWVVEGQLGGRRSLDATPPFVVVRVPLVDPE